MRSACSDFVVNPAVNRRVFLQAGGLSLFGLGLPQLAKGRGARSSRPRAKACIVLFMWGRPAQQGACDMKPGAPAGYRGEFQPISTMVPGLQICEHLPRLAQRADKLTLIRSMTHDNVDHTRAT